MSKVVLYHNPRCRKSREAKALLETKEISFEVVEYLKNPLSKTSLKKLLKMLSIPAHDLLRTKEPPYKALCLSKNSSDDAILSAIAEHPQLLERPIVQKGEHAVIARPAENLEELF